MSYFRRLRGTPAAALGLSLLLLGDALAVGPVAAAPGTDQAGLADVDAAGALVCATGFGDVSSTADMSLHGVTLTDGGALAVGFTRGRDADDFGRRRTASLVNRSGDWTRVSTRNPGEEDGLVAVDSRDGKHAWAVGFTTIEGQVMPLAMRWNGRRWRTERPRPRTRMTSLYTDVVIVGRGDPVAVGYRMTPNGRRQPISARYQRGKWRNLRIRTAAHESVTLAGVAVDKAGGLWAVGHGGPGAELSPVIYRHANGRWKRQRVPRLQGEAVLADVVGVSRDESWAVGYQRGDTYSQALVMRWDGRTWRKVAGPLFDSPDVQLTAVSAPADGGIWVVGAAWNADLVSHQAVAARWDGEVWKEITDSDAGTELHDVIGSLDGSGWAVGRSGQSSRATRACVPAQSGIPWTPGPAVTEPLVPQSGLTPDDDSDQYSADAETVETGSATTLLAQDSEKKTKAWKSKQSSKAKKAKQTRKAKRALRAKRRTLLPVARLDATIEARDATGAAGIAEETGTYDAVVADFDGDGVDDIYIGRHGRRGRLMLNRDGVFEEHRALRLPAIDRHGCSAADIDGSGLPDLYCTIGGKRGSGLKANELWLDPGGPNPVNVAMDSGVADPTGRGRQAAFLEAEGQEDISLVVANSPVRVDGLPSIGRHYESTGGTAFTARARPGFAPRLGALHFQDADFDGDGREDLLMVTGGPQSPVHTGTRLYRNTPRGLVDVTRKMGIRTFDEVDAELADLDGDGRLDLVQLAPHKIRVSTMHRGKFRTVWERKLTHGRAVATGDVNGDGKSDIYIVRSNGERNSADVMLVNRNSGTKWSAVVIPNVNRGSGEDAYAIDHDGNGLDDFVILNGHNERGPMQLTAFYPRQG